MNKAIEKNLFNIGVVEDINDPDKLGRVRVRIVGLHTENKTDIPTNSLPWCPVLMSNMSASISGIGITPHGLVNGSWVLTTFLDRTQQTSIVLGSLLGKHSKESNTNIGFNDPTGKYPLVDRVGLPDVNDSAVSKYPHNKVLETTSGHKIEIDDSPGDERIVITHTTGTTIEMDKSGNCNITGNVINISGTRVNIN